MGLNDHIKNLKPTLEGLLVDYDFAARRAADPVSFVWEYEADADREVVGLIASALAYGRVGLLKQSVREVLDVLGPAPSRMVQEAELETLADQFDGFVYRMTRADDVVDLLSGMRRVLETYGSLEACYRAADADDHLDRASYLVGQLRAGRVREELARGLRYLLPDPADGSSCKRLNLYFRWMGRGPDGVDPGTWRSLDASELLMPLDTHTSRLCRYIGLTDRKTVDLKMARQVTDALRLMDPDDPLRYDFALCHLGISGRCIHERSPAHCPGCPIESICTL